MSKRARAFFGSASEKGRSTLVMRSVRRLMGPAVMTGKKLAAEK